MRERVFKHGERVEALVSDAPTIWTPGRIDGCDLGRGPGGCCLVTFDGGTMGGWFDVGDVRVASTPDPVPPRPYQPTALALAITEYQAARDAETLAHDAAREAHDRARAAAEVERAAQLRVTQAEASVLLAAYPGRTS